MTRFSHVMVVCLFYVLSPAFMGCEGGDDNSTTLLLSANDGQTGNELYKFDEAGVVSQIKNINKNTSSYPQDYLEMNGNLYFSATDGIHGRELWKSDGNSAALVKDINNGAENSDPSPIAVVNGTLFFVADDGTHGRELWKTDGTVNGTSLVYDINPGANSSSPAGAYGLIEGNYIVYNNELYFVADDGSHGTELWKTNGADTSMVADLNGASAFADRAPQNLTLFNGAIYFLCVCDSSMGLWMSDGTGAGTFPVVGIDHMSYPSPNGLTVYNGALYFSGNGSELWKSDGSALGSVLVKDINPGSAGAQVRDINVINNKLFFIADDGSSGQELWVSDGSESGTNLVLDIYPGINDSNPDYVFPYGSYPSNLTEFNGEAYFTATDGVNGYQLWKSDGTANGTLRLTTLSSGSYWPYGSRFLVNGALYFSIINSVGNRELYKSDGTAQGTKKVTIPKDLAIYPWQGYADTENTIAVFKNELYLPISDGVHGFELYKTDGTANGTIRVADINASRNDDASSPIGGAWFNDEYYFAADDGIHGYELWKTNGTNTGTGLVKDIDTGFGSSSPQSFREYNNELYFVARDTGGSALWKTDGTSAGMSKVMTLLSSQDATNTFNFYIPSYYAGNTPLVVYNNELYFIANDGIHGQELYKTNGVTTRLVKDINPGAGYSSPFYITISNGKLYFIANDGLHGDELWKSDGTEQGTVMVKDIYPGLYGSQIFEMVDFNGELYFTPYSPDYGTELWKTDGTQVGTVMVRDINHYISPINGSNPSGLTVVNDALYFYADDGVTGKQLWKTDGTHAGTTLVKSIFSSGFNYYYYYSNDSPAVFDNKLYFIANDGNGDELWVSDGTDAGTSIVKNINPTKTFSESYGIITLYSSSFKEVNGKLFFLADDGVHGRELWASDGTSGGTKMIQDVNPGKGGGVASLFQPN